MASIIAQALKKQEESSDLADGAVSPSGSQLAASTAAAAPAASVATSGLNNGECTTTKDLTIHFERADKGLGLSIAGGQGSTPYKDGDEGIFISRVTAGGPADIAGLRKDDKVLAVNGNNCVSIDHYEAVNILKTAGSTIDMHVTREIVASDAVQAVQQVLRQQQPNGHHAPAAASSPPQIPKSATVQRPPQLPPLPPTSKRQAPLDSTTTTEPDDSVSLSSLSQPASSHSQKSLLNKSAVVSEVNLENWITFLVLTLLCYPLHFLSCFKSIYFFTWVEPISFALIHDVCGIPLLKNNFLSFLLFQPSNYIVNMRL